MSLLASPLVYWHQKVFNVIVELRVIGSGLHTRQLWKVSTRLAQTYPTYYWGLLWAGAASQWLPISSLILSVSRAEIHSSTIAWKTHIPQLNLGCCGQYCLYYFSSY